MKVPWLVGLLATFHDDLHQSTCYRTVSLDSNHPFLGGSPVLVTLMGGDQAGNLIVFDLIRLSSLEQTGYYTLRTLGTVLMLATAQPSALGALLPILYEKPP